MKRHSVWRLVCWVQMPGKHISYKVAETVLKYWRYLSSNVSFWNCCSPNRGVSRFCAKIVIKYYTFSKNPILSRMMNRWWSWKSSVMTLWWPSRVPSMIHPWSVDDPVNFGNNSGKISFFIFFSAVCWLQQIIFTRVMLLPVMARYN